MEVMPAARPLEEKDDPARLAPNASPEKEEGAVEEDAASSRRRDNGGRKEEVKTPSRGYASVGKPPISTNPMAGGVYVPPAKRRQMMQQQQKEASLKETEPGKATPEMQRQTWQDQKRVIHGTINRLNAATIKPLIGDLFEKVNLIRLRGVLARSVLQAAVTSTQFSSVYAALVAVINTKLPEVGELVVKRAILAFRRNYRRREKASCLAVCMFLGHLFHQAVVHELLILQILTVLLDGDPTNDSVEVAVEFLTVVGQALLEVSPAGVRAVLERLRSLLHEGDLNKRVEYKMEQLFALRKTGFMDHPPLTEDLDLVERDDQITFELSLDDEDITKEESLDVFRLDNDYEENEQEWSKIRAEILGLDDGESETDDSEDETTDDEEAEDEGAQNQDTAMVPSSSQAVTIQDLTEADLVHLRRNIYLTIMSSATFEECVHKLSQIKIPEGREEELINMIIECCSQERTFLRYYGLISARFCLLDYRWSIAFLQSFEDQYSTIHRLETNKLRNVAKLFAHLLHTDSVPWSCLSIIHLNEDETTSSSRIFVKILIQEMAEAMGIAKLKDRFETQDPELALWYKGMFPRDNVRNTRYAINFFTSIGLGPLTDGLREFLKNAPKMILAQAKEAAELAKKNDDDSSVSSSSSSSSSSLSTSSYTSSSSYSSSSSDLRRKRSRRGRSSRRRRRSRSPSYSSSSISSRSSYSSRSVSRSRSPPRGRRRKKRRSPSYSSSSRSRSRSPPRKRKNRISRSTSPDEDNGRDSKSSPREEKAQGQTEDHRKRGRHSRSRSSSGNIGDGRRSKRSRQSRSQSSSRHR